MIAWDKSCVKVIITHGSEDYAEQRAKLVVIVLSWTRFCDSDRPRSLEFKSSLYARPAGGQMPATWSIARQTRQNLR